MKHEVAEALPFSIGHIVMSEFDQRRLRGLLALLRARAAGQPDLLEVLEAEIERADVVQPQDVPPDVITMNSVVEIVDLDTNESFCVTIVFPGTADVAQRRISVLAPIGIALLGCREGDEVGLPTPGRARRLRVQRILFQPEAAGRYDL